ncbi:T9SS type A sorting domain-containing protein [Psychroflexus halocasei]|uniref:Por secretion system C-terminal sorting domain-containing protein n=1 Tax=Psychroflexus halocasei TaxID=908615 RepID=A0A1H4CL14_9FLAO|nr:Por secretion system C-terminal sorting domain-containing protein [Psychroflexus halocasei]
MKHYLLFTLFAFSVFTASAQIADGSVAPDFTATDIDGNTHSLSDYLAEGKTVILNVSATWCGPCWNYKSQGHLSNIYETYGPNGSDEVVVLYVEGDPSTGMNELNGIGNTVGNWVENTPFPIIDNAAIANSYQISYYPTVFRICPDGLVYEAGQLTGSQFESIIQSSFGCDMALTGISEKALASVDDVNLCDDNTAADLSVTVNNYGINPITSVTLGINDGSQITQITESVSIPKWGNAPVTINTVLSNANDYSVSITGINGNAMAAENIMTQDFEVNSAVQALENIEIHIHTDFYPAEASWKLYDSNDVEIAAGGPYQAGTADQFGGGGPDANTTIVHNVQLPMVDECYRLELSDSFGDGWGNTPSNHEAGASIFFDNAEIYNIVVGNFGGSLSIDNIVKRVQSLGNESMVFEQFAMYPNPSEGQVNFKSDDNFSLKIYALNGQLVYESLEMQKQSQIDLSQLAKGIYLTKVTIGNHTKTEKLILK